MAKGLAEQGALVIAVNHPHSSTFDFDIRVGLNHWTRARDVSRALDKLMDDTKYAGRIDLLPQAELIRVPGAYHLSLLPLWNEMGALILEEEGDDPVSTDPEGVYRAAIHAQVLTAISAQLGL